MAYLRNTWKWIVICGVLSLTITVALLPGGPSSAQTAATSAPTSAPDAAATGDVKKLTYDGLTAAIKGDFQLSLADLQKAVAANADDTKAQAALAILRPFNKQMAMREAQRMTEYAAAVERVRRAMMAQAYMPKLAEGGLDKSLREMISKKVIAQFNKVTLADSFRSTTDPESAAKMQKNSQAGLEQAVAGLAEAVGLLKDRDDEYAQTFRKLADGLTERLEAAAKIWQSLKPDDAASRRAVGDQLDRAEDALGDALADIEGLTSEKPWLVAIVQARLAVQLAAGEQKDKVVKEDWYRKIVGDVETIGKKAVEQADWDEALNAYANLEELAPDDENYKQIVKTVHRHVRVLRLYGGKLATATSTGASTQPTTAPAADDEDASWREVSAGVDPAMVQTVITNVSENYVTAPDFKKLINGALLSMKVLAETPQASETFKSLADKAKQKAFVDAIDELTDHYTKKENPDGLDLATVLNDVLRASEKSVEIPVGVLCVEFTDGFLEEMDKFSSMIWPYEVSDFTKQTMGQFYGVGIQIGKEPGEPLKVVSPLEDSPAYKAGIKSGDMILAVDGRKTNDLPVDKLVKMITGDRNTKVVLTIKRPGSPEQDVTLIRDEISIRTIKGWRRLDGGEWDYLVDHENKIGYIRMTQFTEKTPIEFHATLQALKKEGCRSLILDLRFDPGGMLKSAVMVADEFLRDGKIVSTRGRQSGSSESRADTKGEYLDGDLVVLVNQYSASAAEIVSGALKDWHRSVTVGVRSYGKGSVQNVIPLRNRKAILKLTTAYYYLPNGRLLHRRNGEKDWGVDPDVDTPITPKQIKQWLDIRQRTDLLQDVDQKQLDADMKEQYQADIQLDTAVVLLRMMQLENPDLRASE